MDFFSTRCDDLIKTPGHRNEAVVRDSASITSGQPAACPVSASDKRTVGIAIRPKHGGTFHEESMGVWVNAELNTRQGPIVIDNARAGFGHAIGGGHICRNLSRRCGTAEQDSGEDRWINALQGRGNE